MSKEIVETVGEMCRAYVADNGGIKSCLKSNTPFSGIGAGLDVDRKKVLFDGFVGSNTHSPLISYLAEFHDASVASEKDVIAKPLIEMEKVFTAIVDDQLIPAGSAREAVKQFLTVVGSQQAAGKPYEDIVEVLKVSGYHLSIGGGGVEAGAEGDPTANAGLRLVVPVGASNVEINLSNADSIPLIITALCALRYTTPKELVDYNLQYARSFHYLAAYQMIQAGTGSDAETVVEHMRSTYGTGQFVDMDAEKSVGDIYAAQAKDQAVLADINEKISDRVRNRAFILGEMTGTLLLILCMALYFHINFGALTSDATHNLVFLLIMAGMLGYVTILVVLSVRNRV